MDELMRNCVRQPIAMKRGIGHVFVVEIDFPRALNVSAAGIIAIALSIELSLRHAGRQLGINRISQLLESLRFQLRTLRFQCRHLAIDLHVAIVELAILWLVSRQAASYKGLITPALHRDLQILKQLLSSLLIDQIPFSVCRFSRLVITDKVGSNRLPRIENLTRALM